MAGEPLWLSGKVVKNEIINEIERTRVCSPPRATSLKNDFYGSQYPPSRKGSSFIDPFLISLRVQKANSSYSPPENDSNLPVVLGEGGVDVTK
jgi:hypothetical protein